MVSLVLTTLPGAGVDLMLVEDFSRGGAFGLSLRTARTVEPFGSSSTSHRHIVALATFHRVFNKATDGAGYLYKVALVVFR